MVAQDEHRIGGAHRRRRGRQALIHRQATDKAQPIAQDAGIRLRLVTAGQQRRFAFRRAGVAAALRDAGERVEEQVEIHLQRAEHMHQLLIAQRIGQQNLFMQAELGGQQAVPMRMEGVVVGAQAELQRFDIVDQRHQGIGQSRQVPLRDGRLVAVAVTPAFGIGGVRRPLQVVFLQPAVRAVIDAFAQDRHVVGVHHAVHETDTHPARDQLCCALADGIEELAVAVFGLRHRYPGNAGRWRNRQVA